MSDTVTAREASVPRSKGVFIRLCLMMLMQFIVFGSWYATLGLVLGTHGLGSVIGLAYSLGALAAMISPMFLGSIVDRFFSSQRVLAVAHTIGAGLMFLIPAIVGSGNGALALALIFVYMLFFQPTLGLTNSIAFRHLGANERLFPYIRVFGTIGWIVAGLAVGSLGLSASNGVFFVTGVVSLALAAYALTLPPTPPVARGAKFSIGDVIGAKAFPLFRQRNFVVFAICALLTCIPLAMYNSYASSFLSAVGIENVAGVLTIGQVSEVVFIITIPFVLAKIGMKYALLAGMAMWGIRFALFAVATGGHAWPAIVGIALHGISNDFFLILGAMYLDRAAPKELQAQAQSVFVFISSGAGIFLGSLLGGEIYNNTVVSHPEAGAGSWTILWLVPIGVAVVTTIIWTTFFRQPGPESNESDTGQQRSAQKPTNPVRDGGAASVGHG